MNGKQRARWYADLISDAQRLQKKARGCADATPLGAALAKLGDARALALAAISDENDSSSPGADDPKVD
jgi:hypothetical protein